VTRRERFVRLIGWSLGIGALVLVARNADVKGALPHIVEAGPLVVFALVPYLVQISLDARAWKLLLSVLGHRVPWPRLVSIRLATEAVLLTVPGGSVVGESLKPYLLSRTSTVPLPHTVASIGIKRSLLALAQSMYLALALVLGHAVLARSSQAILHTDALPALVGAASAFLLVAAFGLGLAFMHGRVAMRVLAVLGRLPSKRVRAWLAARQAGFASADAAFSRIAQHRVAIAGAAAILLGAWLVETLEAYLLCRLVGIDLPITWVLAMEASVVFVRNLAFFLPAGLGVQDAGYLAFLSAYGIATPTATAFALLKRCKELVWIAVGYLVLFAVDRRRSSIVAVGGLG
jgi:uncharacterized protein (TIRG00374 family)